MNRTDEHESSSDWTRVDHELLDDVLDEVAERNPSEREFLQAVREIFESIKPVIDRHEKYHRRGLLRRLVEPERLIHFRVPWTDDVGEVQVNRGYRVQFSSTLGPYKGGLRFHRSVNPSVLKFLGFEQIFKNSLTGLNLGGGKGGSDFHPKGRSDDEVMRFCQSFMTELSRHIGKRTDVPAGDIGVGEREIGYLFGQYKRLANQFSAAITGKGLEWGGSQLRLEATGYGVAYFAAEMLAQKNESMKGKRCIISGAGNVAQYLVEKLIDMEATVIAMSDSSGFIHDDSGINRNNLQWIMHLKNQRRGGLDEYAQQFPDASYTAVDPGEQRNPLWSIDADCAFPCATENEVSGEDAEQLTKNGVQLICEGANMPLTTEARTLLRQADILIGPGKAANAGGVAVSGFEMAQNASHLRWSRAEVDRRLIETMKRIHRVSMEAADAYERAGDYISGADIAGFIRVADAMLDQGVV